MLFSHLLQVYGELPRVWEISASGQDGVTENKFTPLPEEILLKIRNIRSDSFQTLVGNVRTVILERKERNKVNPMTDPAYCLESIQAMAQKNSGKPISFSVEEKELGIQRTPDSQGSQDRIPERRELHRKGLWLLQTPL